LLAGDMLLCEGGLFLAVVTIHGTIGLKLSALIRCDAEPMSAEACDSFRPACISVNDY